jgi:hypothetical protein
MLENEEVFEAEEEVVVKIGLEDGDIVVVE